MRKNQSAFTLLEIMLVVTIIALLLGTAIYKLSGNVEYARHNRVAADIQSISTQLKLYESMNGFYPTTEQGLQALVTQPEQIRSRNAGISSSRKCRRTPGTTTTSISVRAAKIRTVTIFIPPDRIANPTRPTTIWGGS